MELTIKIKMDNDAFGDDDASRLEEVQSILPRAISRALINGGGLVIDTNGNKVGTIELED